MINQSKQMDGENVEIEFDCQPVRLNQEMLYIFKGNGCI